MVRCGRSSLTWFLTKHWVAYIQRGQFAAVLQTYDIRNSSKYIWNQRTAVQCQHTYKIFTERFGSDAEIRSQYHTSNLISISRGLMCSRNGKTVIVKMFIVGFVIITLDFSISKPKYKQTGWLWRDLRRQTLPIPSFAIPLSGSMPFTNTTYPAEETHRST
jgi:hypothetical protein